jgi:cellulose biosynthesis protein BcsQ
MLLAVGNTKGGVGKTVLAANIAAALAQRGLDVLLIDGDEQASAATFAQIRADQPGAAGFTTIQLQGAAIRQQMRPLAGKYDEIVIDVGGRDTGSLRATLTVADTILIPFQPRSVDLWAGGRPARSLRSWPRQREAPGLRPAQHCRPGGRRQRRGHRRALGHRGGRAPALHGRAPEGLLQCLQPRLVGAGAGAEGPEGGGRNPAAPHGCTSRPPRRSNSGSRRRGRR